MKATKRIIAAVFMVMMLASVMTFPASAAVYTSFSAFPTANSDYANVSLPQTMAVQRFLMCYSDSFQTRLAAHNGTDGYFGSETTSVTKDYQAIKKQERGWSDLATDGRVGPHSWSAIEDDLSFQIYDSSGTFYTINGEIVILEALHSRETQYRAMRDNGTYSAVFYSKPC